MVEDNENKVPLTKPQKTVVISVQHPPEDEDTDFDESYCHLQPTAGDLKPTFRDGIPQILASCIIYCLVIQAGINMSYSAVLLPQILDADSSIPVSTEQASWIGGYNT